MGKAADNEAKKLAALFYNNAAVGVAVAGIFVPYLTLFQRMTETRQTVRAIVMGTAGLENADVKNLLGYATAIALALLTSWFFHRTAKQLVATLED